MLQSAKNAPDHRKGNNKPSALWHSLSVPPEAKFQTPFSTMNQPIDIAVDLGDLPPPLPEILSLRQLVEVAPDPPPPIIEGVLRQGTQYDSGAAPASATRAGGGAFFR